MTDAAYTLSRTTSNAPTGVTHLFGRVVAEHMRAIELRADGTGTIELVCERTDRDAPAPGVRTFAGRDEFGLLVDDLTPDERVTLFVDDAVPGR